jgi:uncharacterized membrane protein
MMMGFGVLVWLFVIGGIVVVLIGGLGWLPRQGGNTQGLVGSRQKTARQVLDERLARGELSSEEYEAIRTQLES